MPGLIVLDTSMATKNTGDEIIAQSVLRLFPELLMCQRIPTHRYLFNSERRALAKADVAVLLGTNVLDAHVWRRRQWAKGPLTVLAARKKVAWLGVGWKFDVPPSLPTKLFLRHVNLPGLPIAARDESTASQVRAAGVPAVNTCCPTSWGLTGPLPVVTDEREVVTTVTDYRPDVARDSDMLKLLGKEFARVLLWPQGLADPAYIKTLTLPSNAQVIEPGLASFERALTGRAFVGTRLHAGMRALQLDSPALIIEVDHRAREMAKGVGLLTVSRADGVAGLAEGLHELGVARTLDLPREEIRQWVSALADASGLDLSIFADA